MKIPFVKAHGTGNDFIIFLESGCPPIIRDPEFISSICRRRTGVGADAVLILSSVPGFDFKMDYFNSDGSWETMCANGARCAGLLMRERSGSGTEFSFMGGDGPHQLRIHSADRIQLKMTPPVYKTGPVDVAGYVGCHVDSGAAHFVTQVKDFRDELVEREAPQIRHSPMFAPRGVNVNFFEKLDANRIRVRTYEKGIERFMMSCGTGSVAAVFHAARELGLKSPVQVQVPGGMLQVVFDEQWQQVWLEGPAVILFQSVIDTKNLEMGETG